MIKLLNVENVLGLVGRKIKNKEFKGEVLEIKKTKMEFEKIIFYEIKIKLDNGAYYTITEQEEDLLKTLLLWEVVKND